VLTFSRRYSVSAPQILIDKCEVEKAVLRLAKQIKRDLKDTNPLVVCILKGSFVFGADLIRALNMPLEIEFVSLSSYGAGTESSGKVRMRHGIARSIYGRHVLVVEDIIDTGITTNHLMRYLRKKKPATLKLCVLLDKPARRQVPVRIDYLGFTVPNKFIVGYGIDWNEQFRYLPDICYIGEEYLHD
jgi:hypoxanthine phosphoribosyltransferase